MSRSRLKSAGRSLLLLPALLLGPGTMLEAQEEHGWIGINFDEKVCRQEKQDEGRVVFWVCTIPPMVDTVYQGGPAYLAGIKAGDVIIGVDGFEIATEEGSRRFSNMRLGVPVTFWLRRGDEELALTVTPATKEEAFPEDVQEWVPGPWVEPGWDADDSLAVQMRVLLEGQLRLQYALKEAEVALRRAESRLREDPSESRRAQVGELRLQIDSINMKLGESHTEIRRQVDTLARRAWMRVPEERAEVRPEPRRVERDEAGVVSVYRDAVAGARFEELAENSPLMDYFPGVDGGLLVLDVVAETPAALCGLRAGDVVLEANEEPVRTVAELRRRMRGELDIGFIRWGREHSCTIPSR
ncbi:MAG: PDZ domain-containing protein [Gemmatimonadota bacterium]|nr:MAG: PDZ domain-containing protein [Gemmatimonadota bacterium]